MKKNFNGPQALKKIVVLIKSIDALLVAMVGSLGFIFFDLKLWNWPLDVPLSYRGDSLPLMMIFKETIERGWTFGEPNLAAPFGQEFYGRNQPSVLSPLIAKLLGLFTSNPAAVNNFFFISSYPVIAATSWVIMRKLGISKWTACALSIVFANLPYHVGRIEHIFLANYFVVPLMVWMSLRVLQGHSLVGLKSTGPVLLRWITWQTILSLIIAVIIAAQDPYYGVFAALLLVCSACLDAIRRFDIKRLMGVALVVAVILLTIGAASYPANYFEKHNGPNPQLDVRPPQHSVTYAIDPYGLITPLDNHRVVGIAEAARQLQGTLKPSTEVWATPLGALASLGLVYLGIRGFRRLVTIRKNPDRSPDGRIKDYLTIVVGLCLVIGSTAGISALIAYYVDASLRGWNRMSIIIGFCAVVAVGFLADRFGAWLMRSKSFLFSKIVLGLLLIAITFGAVYDQTSPNSIRASMLNSDGVMPLTADIMQAEMKWRWYSDKRFFNEIEKRMAPGSMVFQLPIEAFQEITAKKYVPLPYQALVPYIHTEKLKWSFGGEVGRVEYEWQNRISDISSVSDFLTDIVSTGFTGVLVNVSAYRDDAPDLLRRLESTTGVQPFYNDRKNLAFFDISEYAKNLESKAPGELGIRRKELLSPLYISFGEGFRVMNAEQLLQSSKQKSTIIVRNASETSADGRVDFRLRVFQDKANVKITWPDETSVSVPVGKDFVSVSKSMQFGPGPQVITLESDGQCVNPVGFQNECMQIEGLSLSSKQG